MASHPFRLVRVVPRRSRNGRLSRCRRVGLRGLLTDLRRVARVADVPAAAAVAGLRWDDGDEQTTRWYPQGITTSADAYGPDPQAGTFDGRSLVLVSWYGHGTIGRLFLGSRISVIDHTDQRAPRYEHVLLVDPTRWLGRLRPVRVHAGGIVWYGEHLFVAGSSGGIRVFRVDDIAQVRRRWIWKGYRYVLPQHTAYVPVTDRGVRPMTYSFMSLDRSGEVDHLIAGEYGRHGGSHRLVRYALDGRTDLLAGGDVETAAPLDVHDAVPRMQGAVVARGAWVVTASTGEGNPGDLWIGQPGELHRHRGVLPTGPEDITWWPQRDQLWTLTEWPGRRWVYALDATDWIGAPALRADADA